MAKGVFLYRSNSQYDDRLDKQYQFPSKYLKTAQTFEGDWVVYNELLDNKKGQSGYWRIAKVTAIVPDSSTDRMYLAILETESYMEFENFVPYRSGTEFLETSLTTGTNSPKPIVRDAIRSISDADFYRICYRGNPLDKFELPRFGSLDLPEDRRPGVRDAGFVFDFEGDDLIVQRERFEQLTSKPVRSKLFRNQIVLAYDKTCAFTGMRFINGKGRPEVEAAHIRPVEHGGSDRADNGIALSGTVHSMFDRGMISLTDDYTILVSRQINNSEEVWRLMRPSKTAYVPTEPARRPHPSYLRWHRENCFKH